MEVLNPTLYNLLLRHPRFHGDVGIAAHGVAIDWYVVQRGFTDSRTDQQRSKPQRKVRYSGEEYRVNCPYCRDARRRLFINHRWGVSSCWFPPSFTRCGIHPICRCFFSSRR